MFEFDYRNLIHACANRYAFDQKFPNAIGIQYSATRSKDFPTPATAHYCAECQRELQKAFHP